MRATTHSNGWRWKGRDTASTGPKTVSRCTRSFWNFSIGISEQMLYPARRPKCNPERSGRRESMNDIVAVAWWKGEHGFRRCRIVSARSEEHTSELQSLMRISYAVFCLKKKTKT